MTQLKQKQRDKVDLTKTAHLQQTIFQINLLVSSVTHTKLSNDERGKLNAIAKRLERDFINEVLGTTLTNESPVVKVEEAAVMEEAPATKREPARKLNKKR